MDLTVGFLGAVGCYIKWALKWGRSVELNADLVYCRFLLDAGITKWLITLGAGL